MILLTACDGGQAAKPTEQTKAETKAPDAKAAEMKAPEVDRDPPQESIEAEWIVWFSSDRGEIESRWYTKTASGVTMTASRKAMAIGDGASFWQVRRADAKADVFDCLCIDSENDPMCKKTGEVTTLGLEAVPMAGGDAVALETASTETIYGEVEGLSLTLRGGVGTQLYVETTDAGYYCGAHGSYGGMTQLKDPSSPDAKWPTLKIPDPMLRQAAVSENMLDDYKECWDEPDVGMGAFIRDTMSVVSVDLSLDAGMLKLRWNTEADGPYVCTGDYAFHGYVDSGLLPTAKDLGLAPPLGAGLQEAFKEIGTTTAVGWSPVGAEQRETVKAWFEALEETPWPKGESSQTTTATRPDPDDAVARRKLLEQGRTLTREKKYAEAVEVLTTAIDGEPTAPRPYAARCYAYLLSDQLKKARIDCNKALELHPGDRFTAAVQYNLGQIAEKEGKTDEAKAAYEASLKLRDNATVRKALEALQ